MEVKKNLFWLLFTPLLIGVGLLFLEYDYFQNNEDQGLRDEIGKIKEQINLVPYQSLDSIDQIINRDSTEINAELFETIEIAAKNESVSIVKNSIDSIFEAKISSPVLVKRKLYKGNYLSNGDNLFMKYTYELEVRYIGMIQNHSVHLKYKIPLVKQEIKDFVLIDVSHSYKTLLVE